MTRDPYSSDYHEDQAREARRDRGEHPYLPRVPSELGPKKIDPDEEARRLRAKELERSWTQRRKL